MQKQSIKVLNKIYGNRPIAILGGGSSLPDDIERLPMGTILIAVNRHALRLVHADFCVFMDKPSKLTLDATKDTERISQHSEYSNYIIDVPFWNGGFSSTLAAWLGGYLSTGPILLCGMDCYQKKPYYFYEIDKPLTHPVYNYPLENHLKAWRPALTEIENPERIKAVSGPLVEIFGCYTKKDTIIEENFYDPKKIISDKPEWDFVTEEDFLILKNDKRFHIGQGYEKKVVDTCYCNHCGGDQFNVGSGNCYTAIKCITCKYEVCVHEG